MKKVLSFIFVYFATASLSVAFGYSFTEDFEQGFYWKQFPVAIKAIDEDGNEQDRLEGLLTFAIKEWEDGTEYDIWTQVYGTATSNVVRWTDNITAETGYSSETTLGVATRYNVGTFFERFEILLNKNIADLVDNKGNILYQTILHEMGHTVGLGHSDVSAVMFPQVGSFNQLYQDDIDGMKAVIEETQWRQDTNYVSDLAVITITTGCAETGKDAGSVAMTGAYLISILVGIFVGYFPLGFCLRKFFPHR